jgi:hypothetical protein
MFYISPFFLLLNEIILFQILYKSIKYLLFSFMKMEIIKFIQCGSCLINGPKFLKIRLVKMVKNWSNDLCANCKPHSNFK